MHALTRAIAIALAWLDGAGVLGRWIAVTHTRSAIESGASSLTALRAGFLAWRAWQREPLIHRRTSHRSRT